MLGTACFLTGSWSKKEQNVRFQADFQEIFFLEGISDFQGIYGRKFPWEYIVENSLKTGKFPTNSLSTGNLWEIYLFLTSQFAS